MVGFIKCTLPDPNVTDHRKGEFRKTDFGLLAQLVEHIVHIDGVTGSSPVQTTNPLESGSFFTQNVEFTEEARKQFYWRNHADEEVSHRLFWAYL